MARTSTFTSYINVEPAQGVDASFAKLEAQARQSFGRIALDAGAANRAVAGLMGGRGTAGLGGGTASAVRQQAAALREVAVANQRVQTETGGTNSKLGQQAVVASRARKEMSALERTLRTTATTLNVVQGPLGPIAGRIGAMAAAVGELTGFRLGIAGTGAALFYLTSQANKYTEVRSKLVPLFEAQSDVNKALGDSVRIAENARTALEPIVDLYSRLTLAGRDVGLSQQEITRLTEVAAKAAKLSGGTAQSQEAGLYQFSQGIGSGNLGGDELRSVREGTLRLAKAIADGLGVPMAELKKLGKEGKLTPRVIADALEKESARIDRELARLPKTLSSSAQEFQNGLMTMVGGTDQALGFTTALAEALSVVAKNLGTVVTGVTLLGAAFVGSKTEGYVRSLTAQAAAARQARQETLATAKAEVQAATVQRQTTAQNISGLRAERTAVRERLVEYRAAQAEAMSAAREQLQESRRLGTGFENPRATVAYTQAVDRARVANQNYLASKRRLSGIAVELSRNTSTLTGATGRYRTGLIAARGATLTLAGATRTLLAAINPLGIAISLGISLLIGLASRQNEAANAADRMASREDALANVIDFATGKIREQNAALVENERLKGQRRVEQAAADFRGAQGRLSRFSDADYARVRQGTLIAGPERGFEDAMRDLREGRSNITQTRRRLQTMRAPDQYFNRLDDFEAQAQGLLRQRAGLNLLNGNATAADYERLGIDRNAAGAPAAAATEDAAATSGRGRGRGTSESAAERRRLAAESRAAAAAERELQQELDRTDKRTGILDRYDDQPKAIDRAARDVEELQRLVGEAMNGIAEISADNPLGRGLYTQEMADADARRINDGVRRPLEQAVKEQQRQADISNLILQGYEDEAAALERALQIQDDIGQVSEEDFRRLLANERAQQRINDALESRKRISSQILSAAQTTRDSFEDMLVNLPSRGFSAVKDFGRSIIDNMARMQARQLTERLFAGADEQLRALMRGDDGVSQAVGVLERNSTRAADGADHLASATERAADRIEAATANLAAAGTAVTGDIGTPGTPTPAAAISSLITPPTAANDNTSSALGVAGLIASAIGGNVGRAISGIVGRVQISQATAPLPATDTSTAGDIAPADDSGDIVVTARRRSAPAQPAQPGALPTGAQAYNTIFEGFGNALDKTFKTDGFFKKIGGSVGTAFQGAGTGMMASSFARALGIKQSKTGAAIGGAIGSVIPGVGPVIGGLVGGTIGGLFKKTKSGSATIGAGQFGGLDVTGASGNSAAFKKEAEGIAGTLVNQLGDIASALGADLTGSVGVSIGKRKDKFVVDTTGSGKTKGGGTVKFDTEEEAIQYALQDALKDGVLKGISEASQRILQSGKDLQRALEKALLIESIPKRLMQRTDPVRYAVTELNAEFEKMIAALNEGGASAEQYADAQKLYELERADAIKAATSQASAAIQQFMDEMKGGSSSPLNKRTVYDNAAEKLSTFRSDIQAGKVVDQNDLLTAAKNFQDASRSLFGSSESFFADFNGLFDLLAKARDNAGVGGDVTNLPVSPFASDTTVQNALSQLNGATTSQTNILGAKLDQLISLVANGNDFSTVASYGGDGSSLRYLPGLTVNER